MADKSVVSAGSQDSAVERSFVREDGSATLTCPNCNKVKTVSVSQFKERQHRLQVRCSCKHVFRINLDFRQYFRKATKLRGVYALHPPAVGGGPVDILNLSLLGLCFQVSGLHKIEVGQKGRIDFTLDDKKETRLVREFTVKSVKGNLVGCQFIKDRQFEKELGFYLRFAT